MTWWQWGLAVLVAAAGIAFGGFKYGVTTQRKDDADARLRLAVQVDSARTAHAAEVVTLKSDVSRFSTLATLAANRAAKAEDQRKAADDAASSAQDALRDAQSAADSLRAYPPIVEALTRELEVADSARVAYRDALTADYERAALLLRRIAADSVLIQRQAVIIAQIIPPPPPPKSGGLGRAIETGAIGAATTTACAKSVASFGCIAGAVVTIRRLL